MGWSFTLHVKDCIRWYLGKSVPIEYTWVCATQKLYWNWYDMEFHQNFSMPKLSKKKKKRQMVKRSIDQKLRLRNFDARHGRIDTGAVIKNRKGLSCVEGGKGICYQWKEKGQCFEWRPMQFPAWECRSCKRSKCVEEMKYPKAKVTMVPFFDNRADIIWKELARDHLVNSGILPSVNSTKSDTGSIAWDKCLVPHHKVDEQPNKKPPKSNYSDKRRGSDDKNAVALVFASRKTRKHQFLK